MTEVLFVSLGGFFGAIGRFIISKSFQKHNQSGFPIGTLTVNLTGAFLLGLIVGIPVKGHLYNLLGVGFMGAFTTFSTFKLELSGLKKGKKNKLFFRYLVISYLAGIILAFLGILIGKKI
ncbi:fluoride efflux transporter CrcB [Neobacillus cucumis]|uniref:fluoride efflux transporter CrcB n=1 Tax=Neobacillus cucumis TaxID=1740721 RepID=UPI0018DF457D|nr:fluoride efflux transporter CrcB [Neobacillus cucumis]MBI0575944.1 fluoride efflux transporter CrcB [Neobacillus cucumis]WHY90139.1 fluoride efflux transporter CrcB [Neobacillus cucumis]